MGSLVMLATAPFANLSIFSNVMALEENPYSNYENQQRYEDYTDNYRVNSSHQSNYENGYGYNEDYGYNENGYGYNEDYGYNENGYGYNEDYGYNENGYGYNDKNKPLQIFPANKVSELGDRWWQWITGLNSSLVNPFTDLNCDVGLQDNDSLLFLVGSPKDNETGFQEHECGIPKGTSILFPIVNVVCDDLEPRPFFGQTEQEQRICANDLIDTANATDLHVEIDGYEVKNPEQYRIDSPAGGFEFTAVENNPLSIPPGNGTGVSDGFWILLKPLKPGEHTITFSGKIDISGKPFEVGATYFLEIQPDKKSNYPNANYQNYSTY